MQPIEIIQAVEKIAPPRLAAPWDRSGVQVAAFRSEVGRAAVMLDPTPAGIARAVQDGAEFIVAHHPLSMQPVFPDKADAYLTVLRLLLSHDVWLYSAHTSLDTSPHGTADWLAEDLDLARVEVLEPTAEEEGATAGFGVVGDLPGPCAYEEFCRRLAGALGRSAWQSCGPRPAWVSRIACCPGSGSGLAGLALAAGADLLITGDVKYHVALETGIRILDVGHFCLEEEMMRRFAARLESVLPVPVTFYPGSDPLAFESAGPDEHYLGG